MRRQTSMGTCSLCGKDFSRLFMTRHLITCSLPGPKLLAVSPPAKQMSKRSFHLFVDARYAKAYWMHLAVPVEAPLHVVDAFLRQIWLECCGHLSAFTIEGGRYSSEPMGEFEESGMGVRLSRILRPGMVFSYEYDFGSTTELTLKVLGLRDLEGPRGVVKLLARNHPPAVACDRCGRQPATEICIECACEDQGWLCASCAEAHECSSEMRLPVVNSPRTGVCAYAG